MRRITKEELIDMNTSLREENSGLCLRAAAAENNARLTAGRLRRDAEFLRGLVISRLRAGEISEVVGNCHMNAAKLLDEASAQLVTAALVEAQAATPCAALH